MNPKKPKEFIKPTAEELELKESIVDDVVSFYWNTVRKVLSNLESPSVSVTNLGTFKVRYNKIEKLKQKYENYLSNLNYEEMTFNQHTILNISKAKIASLDLIKSKMEEERQRKLEVKQKRKEYESNKDVESQE